MKILTFDLEDWFHLLEVPGISGPDTWSEFSPRFERNLRRIVEVLDERQIKATFYCLGWIAEKYPKLIRNLAESGHEIGCHSYEHQLAYTQSPLEFRADLKRAIDAISDATGLNVESYRAPGFSVTKDNLWVYDILYEEGIRYDSSVFPASRAHGGLSDLTLSEPCILNTLNGYKIFELPMSVVNVLGSNFVFSGGGYFRILPSILLNSLFSRQQYIMTYFHPRDFDPDQPIVPNLSRFRHFKSYVGLSGSTKKLVTLLDKFEFVSAADAIRSVDWRSAKTIELAALSN
ncbi:polysaccharide deacetylase family protein [Pseudohongiella sp. O18]|uniref:polysaccharide deacetylase family protein n=1 Tax=Pseudohongiella sp. O18 TaxID=2904248 RepID=UPI001F42D3E9|nr:polysaccharide deacetylase family protein [Pseudohongiella sp. O18]